MTAIGLLGLRPSSGCWGKVSGRCSPGVSISIRRWRWCSLRWDPVQSHCDPELAKRMGEKLGEEDLGKEDWREGSARRRRWLRGEGGGRRGRGGEEQEQTALIKSS